MAAKTEGFSLNHVSYILLNDGPKNKITPGEDKLYQDIDGDGRLSSADEKVNLDQFVKKNGLARFTNPNQLGTHKGFFSAIQKANALIGKEVCLYAGLDATVWVTSPVTGSGSKTITVQQGDFTYAVKAIVAVKKIMTKGPPPVRYGMSEEAYKRALEEWEKGPETVEVKKSTVVVESLTVMDSLKGKTASLPNKQEQAACAIIGEALAKIVQNPSDSLRGMLSGLQPISDKLRGSTKENFTMNPPKEERETEEPAAPAPKPAAPAPKPAAPAPKPAAPAPKPAAPAPKPAAPAPKPAAPAPKPAAPAPKPAAPAPEVEFELTSFKEKPSVTLNENVYSRRTAVIGGIPVTFLRSARGNAMVVLSIKLQNGKIKVISFSDWIEHPSKLRDGKMENMSIQIVDTAGNQEAENLLKYTVFGNNQDLVSKRPSAEDEKELAIWELGELLLGKIFRDRDQPKDWSGDAKFLNLFQKLINKYSAK